MPKPNSISREQAIGQESSKVSIKSARSWDSKVNKFDYFVNDYVRDGWDAYRSVNKNESTRL